MWVIKSFRRCDINFQCLWMLLDVHIVDTICGKGCICKLNYVLYVGSLLFVVLTKIKMLFAPSYQDNIFVDS